MDVRLLGPIEVRLEDRPIGLGPRKQRAVLAILALQRGRTVSTDHLVDGLWGDAPPASAPKMVQLYVSRLRRVLGSDGALIVTRGRGYELRLSDGEVDVARAERFLDECRAREALELWRGEPLADLAAEPFAAAEIRRLRELRLRAAEMAIDADLAAGRHAEVIGEIDALAAEYPLREGLHGRRMVALYRSGRQAEALEAYRDARAALVEQIGVEPGPELRRLHAAMLAQDPALDSAEPPAARAGAASRPARVPNTRLLVAAAALLIAGVLAFGVIRLVEPDSLPGIRENSVGLMDLDGRRVTKQYGVGRTPSAIVAGDGSVWIANAGDGTVTRIDRKGGKRVSIRVGGAPAAVAFGAGALWVADSESRAVVQVDPAKNVPVRRIEVGNAPRALAIADGALWVASGVDGRLTRVDLARARVAGSVQVGADPSDLVAGAGALWVASEEADTVTRIEPRTGTVVTAIPVGHGPSALASGEGGIWVVNRHDGTLSRIDPARNAVVGLANVGTDPTAVAAGGGRVWVAGGEDGVVAQVDPKGPRVIAKRKTGNSPAAIAVAGGSVWVAAGVPQAAHRGGTLRVLIPGPPPAIPIDPLHPFAYQGVHTFQLSSLAYDTLVAYRRVAGAAGATLVGALATTAPPPSRDGRTYVFTLRRGLRFSNGRAVRPEDFRASMERFLKATRNHPPPAFPPVYAGILGARRCLRGGPCDLSRGIVTDAKGRTITIHLERPDSVFLHKLTMTWAAVVPAGSPARATLGVTPPGTGPYRVARWNARRGGLLVRNPYFGAASRRRPAGFADRIEVRVRRERTMEAQIRDVQRGNADVAVVASPFLSAVTPDRLRALLTDSPGRVYSGPVATTDWMFLNVRRRPFDDLRVRRALNLAVDRRRIVDLSGGPEAGQPACQVVPIGFAAHEPYCPYTARPSPAGTWTAPDLDLARRLVAASGRAGEHVVVWMPKERRSVGRYITTVLNRLGFRATLNVPPGNGFDTVYKSRTGVQIGPTGWSADYLAPATFIETNFTCAVTVDRGGLNLGRLCDRTLERRIDRARTLPPADAAAAWVAADHRLTRLAAAVPMTNRRAVVLVSRRVGNVQNHAQWFTLLDELWVR